MKLGLIKTILLGSLISGNVLASELSKTYKMTTEFAEEIAKSAINICKQSNTHVSVSVVNDQGRLMYFYRGDNSGSNTIHTSFRKAYTAATLKAPTSRLALITEATGFSQLGKMEDDILLLTGGLPIVYKDTLVGAVGLSGSPNPILEEECGNQAIKQILK